jgi:hypothetical protein
MYHVLLIFPLNQQPWKQRCQSWSTRNPLQDRDWIYGVGHIVGILNPELLKVKPPNYEDMPILVIIPSEWQITGKLQLEGAPPPPYMNTQQSVDPTTPSSQNQIRSRRYGTSSSPEQTRQTGMQYPLILSCTLPNKNVLTDHSELRPILPAQPHNTCDKSRCNRPRT